MTTRLPANPSMEQLRTIARDLHRDIAAGDDAALAALADHHPRPPADPSAAKRSDAQLVVARWYGFPSWNRLRSHVELRNDLARSPHEAPVDDSVAPEERFAALACLTYGGDHPDRRRTARDLLTADPSLATRDVWSMAVAGEAAALAEAVDGEPQLVNAEGGPLRWPPLLYAAYSRLEPLDPGRSLLDVAQVLLDRGADPDAGYLWEGLHSPFTALTGAFGGGEDAVNQPPHPDSEAFARLLLQHGADPNDNQALYNRMFDPDDSHLVLLFEHGLGTGDGGPWHQRLGDAAESIPDMLAMQLQFAASRNMPTRVRLLLDHGVEPDGQCGHPTFHGRSAIELAQRIDATEVVDMLFAAGASPPELDDDQRFVAACMRADEAEARRLLAADPGTIARLEAQDPPTVLAASAGNVEALRLMVALGCDVDAVGRIGALHEAASNGDLATVQALLDLGADPNARDNAFDAPALGWARHEGHDGVIALLEPLTEE